MLINILVGIGSLVAIWGAFKLLDWDYEQAQKNGWH